MILEAIFTGISAVIFFLFEALPSLPPMASAISSGGDWLISQIGTGVGIVITFLSPPLFTAVVGVVFALLFFERIYDLLRWIVAKLPFNIR